MGFSCGIVGLPNVGKSTLFNALTSGAAEVGNYPFTTVESNTGFVVIPDSRLERAAKLAASEEIIPTAIEFVDIAGLVKGASTGEGLGNKFLGHVREVDAVAHVVRCFAEDTVGHMEAVLDPVQDVEIVRTEMALSDLETLKKRREKIQRALKANVTQAKEEMAILDRLSDALQKGASVRNLSLTPQEEALIRELFLLTFKPVVYVANVSEADLPDLKANPLFVSLADQATSEGAPVVAVSAKIESEIAELSREDAGMFLQEMGIGETGSSTLVKTCYDLLGLITFFTANSREARAWTVPKGTPAQKAAGRVHSDMERGFIRAEVLAADALLELESFAQAREKGILRLEGRDYPVCDGDLIYFRFAT